MGPAGTARLRICRSRSERREGKRHARRCRGMYMASGWRRRVVVIRSRCWRSKRPSRVPELVPIRYGRMLVSPFTFYRGAAYLMAADLERSPRTGLSVQLCGDAHLSNFGGFAAPDRRHRVRRQRLRRDAARTVRVGSQAAGRELRGRRPRPRLSRRPAAHGEPRGDARVSRGDPQPGVDEDIRSVVLAGRCRGAGHPVSKHGERASAAS